MDIYTIIEIVAVALNLIYLILLIKEKKACWYFGILGSLISIYLFYKLKLYSEAILFIYYVIIGVYGLLKWNSIDNQKSNFKITFLKKKNLVNSILFGILMSLSLSSFFKYYTDANSPVLDAFTTIFSFIASYFEANKKINSWYFWIVINTLTLFLYYSKELYLYSALTLIYTAFSFIGLAKWKQRMEQYN